MTHWQPGVVVRSSRAMILLAPLIACVAALIYYSAFADALNFGQYTDGRFIAIVIPDTYSYLTIIDFDNPLRSILTSTVANTLGPSAIWYMLGGSWAATCIVNALFLALTLFYFLRIMELVQIPIRTARWMMLLVAFLPTTIYYSVGALKELPTLFFLTAFLYHYNRGHVGRWLLIAAAAVIFRYQLVFVFAIFVAADLFGRRSVRVAFAAIMLVAAAYPLLKLDVFGLESSIIYREEAISAGIGGGIEHIRNTVPVASAAAVLIRVGQSIVEPAVTVWTAGFELEYLTSIIAIVYMGEFILLLPIWARFVWRLAAQIVRAPVRDKLVRQLFTFCVAYVIPVGGFAFVHHRYLYPITALLIVAAIIPRRVVRVTESTRRASLAPGSPMDSAARA